MNPALTSHVLDDIKILFSESTSSGFKFKHAYVADASEIFCTDITKFKYTAVQAWKIDCFILFTIEPEHEINLRGTPYELVPGYFVNSDQRRPRKACAFAQSRKGLAAYYHKV